MNKNKSELEIGDGEGQLEQARGKWLKSGLYSVGNCTYGIDSSLNTFPVGPEAAIQDFFDGLPTTDTIIENLRRAGIIAGDSQEIEIKKERATRTRKTAADNKAYRKEQIRKLMDEKPEGMDLNTYYKMKVAERKAAKVAKNV